MPQLLTVIVDGKRVGQISTSNKSGTVYDVRFHLESGETVLVAENVDTGVERQPQEKEARVRDFKNDFVHAQRAIAAAIATADSFIESLAELGPATPGPVSPILIQLSTNKVSRGFIQVEPTNGESVEVQLVIGAGAPRVSGAQPTSPYEFDLVETEVQANASHVVQALEILRSCGEKWVDHLGDQADQV